MEIEMMFLETTDSRAIVYCEIRAIQEFQPDIVNSTYSDSAAF